MTENPHCGNAPRILPTTGPNFPDFLIIFSVLEFDLCSKNSIIKYTINRNGKSFIESISASNITSFTINHLINI